MSEQRQRILDCAREIYLDQGLSGLSMRKIADCVGHSATALYRHFQNKEELLYAVIGDGFQVFADYLEQAMSEQDPEARLRLTGEQYLRFGLEQSRYYEVIFSSPHQLSSSDTPAEVRRQADGSFDFLIQRVVECQRAGLLRSTDSRDLAISIWTACHGLVSLYLAGHFGTDPERLSSQYRQTLNHLFEGIHA